jgi:protocatechuate 3,4-dioxygenase beta subunit
MTANLPQVPPGQADAVPMFEGRPLANPRERVFDQGLRFDFETLVDRRHVLKLFGYAGLSAGMLAILGCSPGTTSSPAAGALSSPAATASTAAVAATSSPIASTTAAAATAAATTTAGATAVADCTVIPEETAGPFPGDGSNGPDVLTLSGIVRSDIRPSFAGASGTAEGVPLTIRLAIQDVANGCAPIAGAAVYVWHCDRDGQYSLYSQAVTDQNYLRGVQATDANGVATFTSIFPACYSGRWPHIHFEVYPSIARATDQANRIATSQIALPQDACTTVYATDGYSQSVTNLRQVTLQTDNVFGDDGGIHEIGTVTGDVTNGMTVTLTVPVTTA